jgi:type II secretory pathway pseudopilin PulG
MRFYRVNQLAVKLGRSAGCQPAVSRIANPRLWALPTGSRRYSRLAACATRRIAAFTLAEVLAALAFMAIVIPVAVNGLRVANLAGQVGQRKAIAARVAERVLNEWTTTSQSQTPAQSGTVREGIAQFRWSIQTETWNQDAMRLITVRVFYPVQGQEYEVHASTLMGSSAR